MDDLTVDLLILVMQKAKPTVYELCAWPTINRRMKLACYSPKLWRSVEMVCDPGRNVYGWGLEMLADRLAESTELVLTGLNVPERPNPWIHIGLERALEKCGAGSLRKLHLRFVCQLPFTDLLLTKVGTSCPHLEDFELSATNYFATDSAVATFVRACPKVVHFRCFVKEGQPLHALGDSTLWQVAKKWPHVRTFEMNAHHITENGLFALEDCRQLERLGLHGYKRGIFDRAKAQEDEKITEFPNLKEVLFAHMLPSAGELRRLVRMCPQLQRLELQPEETDERMRKHAENLQASVGAEFPNVGVEVRVLYRDGVERVTATMLAASLLEKEKRQKAEEDERTREWQERQEAGGRETDEWRASPRDGPTERTEEGVQCARPIQPNLQI